MMVSNCSGLTGDRPASGDPANALSLRAGGSSDAPHTWRLMEYLSEPIRCAS